MMYKTYLLILWLILVSSALEGCHSVAKNHSKIQNVHVSLGIAYLQQGNLQKARSALNQALWSQPRDPDSWGAMGYLEETSSNLTMAADDYRRAIQLDPQQGEAHNNYGVFLCRHGQQRAGIQELLLAVKLPAYIYRAQAYQNAGLCAKTIPDLRAANEYFKAAQRNDPHWRHPECSEGSHECSKVYSEKSA